jgi:hypothetical protein
MQDHDKDGPAHVGRTKWIKPWIALGAVALALAGSSFVMYHRAGHEPGASAAAPAMRGAQLADFGRDKPSADARLMANWVVATHDNGKHAFLLVDKKDARVYVFEPDGHLRDSAPALMGAARGDTIVPGSGDKPLSAIQPDEKITPSGRFVAEPGLNVKDEDVIWVDYDNAISMHRVRPLVEQERRLERLATQTTDDNRISFGCINLPVSFYEDVAKPEVTRYGAIIYVLPEVKTAQEVFGAYDVTDPAQVAAAKQAHPAKVAVTAHKDGAAPQG